ncbi:MAG TPA: PIN domain-containing protein [Thermoanaerobaculia bacterium]|jgi:predicted nucleic acid-binding protein
MQQYFVDTWYLIALYDRFDGHHAAARAIGRRLASAAFVTHDAVLTEMLTFFADTGARNRVAAAQFIRAFMRTATVVPADRALFLAALDRYESRPDKEYSLVDCMSMLVMERRGIRHVLTNDHHFTQAGFVVVNE